MRAGLRAGQRRWARICYSEWMNIGIVTEAGVPVRAWFDWYSPTTRIWMETLQEGAAYPPMA